jgi:hypothetical protein
MPSKTSKDPLSAEEIMERIHADLASTFAGKYVITILPNIIGVYYGRDVRYVVEQLKLPDAIEAISATHIRKELGLWSRPMSSDILRKPFRIDFSGRYKHFSLGIFSRAIYQFLV